MGECNEKVLYEDDMFKITPFRQSIEEHSLWIGKKKNDLDYFTLPRGTLEEIGTNASPERARVMMDNLTSGIFSHCIENKGASPEGLVIACARATIQEWRERFNYAAEEAREYRDQSKTD